jgi:glycerol-1-phosphate dehydrogenase [NAD(P)+]
VAVVVRSLSGPLIVEVRERALEDLGGIVADRRIATTGRIAVAIGSGVASGVRGAVEAAVPGVPLVEVDGGSLAAARTLAGSLREKRLDALVGIGGGGSLDVAKWAATAIAVPFVSVATTLTHDGLASPVAVLEEDSVKMSYGVQPPIAVIVDLDLVRSAPANHTRSGIGEAVSNLSAVADWELARDLTGEPYDGLAAAMATTAALAVLNQPASAVDGSFLRALADALVVSGLAMTAAGTSRPCSGACHEISHAIDRLFPGTALHGEQVAVGTLFASFLRGDDRAGEIDRCFRRHGVPRLPADLGLDAESFVAAVAAAPDTRPGRVTILEHLDMDERAIRERVDAFIETFDR